MTTHDLEQRVYH